MEQIALIAGNSVIYWKNLVLTAAAFCAVLWFVSFYVKDRRTLLGALAAVPLTALLGLYAARIIHWYCYPSSYGSFLQAVTDLGRGGYALLGVFFGALVTAALLRLLKVVPKAGPMLNSMALAGAAGIGVGRFASLFDNSCRGPRTEAAGLFPLVMPIADPVSGRTEYRLATFLLQAAAAWIIFFTLLALRGRKGKRRDDLWLVFLVLYGASQAVLDSTRYDHLAFRSNGFVGIVQALGAAAMVFAAVVFSVRMVRARGLRPWAFGLWLGILGALGGAGYMEYYVQRHGYKALFSYSLMTAFLALAAALIFAVRGLSRSGPVERRVRKKLKRALPRLRLSRKQWTVAGTAVLVLAVLAGAAGLVFSRYIPVCGTMVRRDAQVVDLRDREMTEEDYLEVCRRMPEAEILWNVPFQGGIVPSDSTWVNVSSLTLEDMDALAHVTGLEVLDAGGCSDLEMLLVFRERFPECRVRYPVILGGAEYPNDVQELSVTDVSAQELQDVLRHLTEVTTVSLRGELPQMEELRELMRMYPQISFHWELMAGDALVDDGTTELVLTAAMDPDQVERLLGYLPALERADLRGTGLTDEQCRALAQSFPETAFLWDLEFGTFRFPTDASEIDVSGMQMEGPEAVEQILPYFSCLERVIMCGCGLDNETMAALNEKYEDIRFVWSIQMRHKTIRTDDVYFYPYKLYDYSSKVKLTDEDLYPLRYCEDMVCIDIGHMFEVTNCEWAAFMPELQYLIIGETHISDLTPLSGCKKLKYLEMFTTPVTDYSPLLGCTGLEDLCLGNTYGDPTPIMQMTWLKHLWWSGVQGTVGKPCSNAHIVVPPALPDTEVKFRLEHAVSGGWRQLDNYYAMRDLMGMFYLR